MSNTTQTPNVYDIPHVVTGEVPVWCYTSYSAPETPDRTAAASGFETDREVDEIDARLTCNCGEELASEAEALAHLHEKAGEILTIKEGPDGETEVLDRQPPSWEGAA